MHLALTSSNYCRRAFSYSCRVLGLELPRAAVSKVVSMVSAFARLVRDDEGIRLINDSAQGIAPSNAVLAQVAIAAGGAAPQRVDGSWSLRASGFYGYD